MKKVFAILLAVTTLLSFAACKKSPANDGAEASSSLSENFESRVDSTDDSIGEEPISTESSSNEEHKATFTTGTADTDTIISNDGTEYTFAGIEGEVLCFGEWGFIGHVEGEKKSFVHLDLEIKTGMYSVNGEQNVLVRYYPDNEFYAVYVKSDLLKTEITLENCIRFGFVKGSLFNKDEETLSKEGVTECEQFLNEIRNGQTAEDAGLYDSVKQPDGTLKNCYVYGYVCGVIQEDINIVIPLEVTSFDDKAYSIKIDDTEYVLSKEWVDKLTAE